MNSLEARVGMVVGLLDGVKRTGKGRIGTFERIYGDPDDLAMDVRFEDGSVALYWYDELRRMEGHYRRPKLLQAYEARRDLAVRVGFTDLEKC